MNMTKSGKGIVLALVLAFLALFVMGTTLYLTLTTTDFRMAKKSTYASKAFFLAESGIHKALYGLRKIPGYSGEGATPVYYDSSSKGEYEVSVNDLPSGDKQVVSTGYFPNKSSYLAKKSIEVVMSNKMPPGFWGNAVFAGEDVALGPNSIIGGTIKYGDSIDPADTPDASLLTEAFPMLNFETLKALAEAQIRPNGQNNLYTVADIAAKKPFPTSFWFDETTVPKTPNIVYVETDLALNGSVGIICGFFVVAGDVLTNTSPDPADTTINGNGTVDGCIYTLGDFRINGGGKDGLEVSGGVWAQGGVELKGKGEIGCDMNYQNSMAPYVTTTYEAGSWKEKH